jgi:hypothetical protein
MRERSGNSVSCVVHNIEGSLIYGRQFLLDMSLIYPTIYVLVFPSPAELSLPGRCLRDQDKIKHYHNANSNLGEYLRILEA